MRLVSSALSCHTSSCGIHQLLVYLFIYLLIHPNSSLLSSVPYVFAEMMVLQRKALTDWRSGGWNLNSCRRQL